MARISLRRETGIDCHVPPYMLRHTVATPVPGMDSPNRYACRYLNIGAEEVRTAGQKRVLPASITEILDREPPTLPQL